MSVQNSPCRRLGAVLAALLAAVVMVGAAGAPATAIVGSPADPDDYRFTVRVQIGDRRVCSGAMVHPLWVLTAKSCFAAAGRPAAAGPPATDTSVIWGNIDLAAAEHSAWPGVIDLVPHPERDLVLAEVTSWAAVRPVEIATTPPRAGERLRVTGFGRTGTAWVPDRLHTATFTVGGVEDTRLTLVPDSPGAAICKGDAGGAAFRDADDRVELVGIHHTSWQNGCYKETETRQGATETRVDDLGAWVATTTTNPEIWARDNVDYRGRTVNLCYSSNGKAQLVAGGGRPSLRSNVTHEGGTQRGQLFVSNWLGVAGLRFQSDGNLVVYDSTGKGVWSTGTSGHPNARLVCESDGGATIYDGSTPVWQSGTAPALHAGSQFQVTSVQSDPFHPTYFCLSADRATYLEVDDGVLKSSDGWRSPRELYGAADDWTVRFQNDGNLVVDDENGDSLWSSKTHGHPAARLVCEDAGNVAIYDGTTKLWDSASYPTGRLVSAAYPDQCAYVDSRVRLHSCYYESHWTFNPDKTIQWTQDLNVCMVEGDYAIPQPAACVPAHPNRTWERRANGSLVNSGTGKCLHAIGPDTQARMQACDGSAAQRWILRPDRPGDSAQSQGGEVRQRPIRGRDHGLHGSHP
ncbi:trypsin-like serine protease [Nonomuraea sp. LPB2021202275-12-8]|uniref:trypsin-like serine protease n=1 Tax=Nonomuraea sp. LPB2021202275-12-8 TaxID=3120159 RepID=UPI00300C4A04